MGDKLKNIFLKIFFQKKKNFCKYIDPLRPNCNQILTNPPLLITIGTYLPNPHNSLEIGLCMWEPGRIESRKNAIFFLQKIYVF